MKQKSIFIVEDDPNLTSALTRRLEAKGFSIRSASDGLDAFAKIFADPPGFILLDIKIPHVNGFVLCEKIKAAAHLKQIPIIMMTGLAEDKIKARCRHLSVDYVLKGPSLWPHLEALIDQSLAPSTPDNHKQETTHQTRKPLVLMVDDDPDVLKALKLSCESVGMQAETANNANDGFLKALAIKPDVIVSDYSMPEGSGLYFIQRLRNAAATRNIPVIYLTGQVLEDNRADTDLTMRLIRQEGVAAFLQKPLNFALLYEVFTKKLGFQLQALTQQVIRASQPRRQQGQKLFGARGEQPRHVARR